MDPELSLNDSNTLKYNQTLNADKTSSIYGEEQHSDSLYNSALDNLSNGSTLDSLNGSLFYDFPSAYGAPHDKSPNQNSTFNSTDISENTINNSSIDNINMNTKVTSTNNDFNMTNHSITNTTAAAMNASALFIQSESSDTNTSLDEVDPKSQLANKTIFKSDNPNLSIIEINDNSIKEQDLENAVVLIEDDEEVGTDGIGNEKNISKNKKTYASTTIAENNVTKNISPNKTPTQEVESAADKRRKRAESLIHSSKQKLDIAIAEASAAADTNAIGNDLGIVGNTENKPGTALVQSSEDVHPETKREIKVYDTIEEFEQNLPSTVTLLDTPFGSRVYLVGTAHFSEESQDDVSFVIRNVRPDVVMVELCPSRIHILKLDEKTLLEEAKNFNISKIRGILHAHGYINGIFFILLLQMSAQIAKDLGMAPGGEFRRAFEEIHRLPGCMLHLGDRPIRITLHRALRALSLWQTIKLVWRLTSTDTISIEEVEECKQRDLLEKLMQEMAGEFPAFSDVFVKERDLFLCHSLQLAALPQTPPGSSIPRPVRVVGVVGIGHAKGIAQMWGRVDPQKIPEIMNIPPASLSTRIAKYTVKYGLLGLTLYGAFKIIRPRLSHLF